MPLVNYEKLISTPLNSDPYNHLVVEDFVFDDALQAAIADYPKVPGPGSHPPAGLDIKGNFKALVDELYSVRFQQIVEDKFKVDLTNRPKMYTVRGYCRATDGKIHPDSTTKIITCLLYMNDKSWTTENSSGNLRLLRDDHNLENFAAEVAPKGGTLLLFKREDYSWHGHHPFEGKRRAIQLNWVNNRWVVIREQGRHNLNSWLKRLVR